MRLIGKLTTATLLGALGLAASFAWRSRGELQRYMKMRGM